MANIREFLFKLVKNFMLSFFTRIFGRETSSAKEVKQLYTTLITQARHPQFYLHYGVEDSVEGRLEMIYLHLFMIFHRLKDENTPLKQALFDYFVAQTDANLREMSVGDLKVPKLMKAVGQNFYGRSAAYTQALEPTSDSQNNTQSNSQEKMQAALTKNISPNISLEKRAALSNYIFTSLKALDATPLDTLPAFTFPEII
jgi:cytochrome b pre-mRNA-processing protein 3